ncbi:hypothetical protein BH09ACT8_BH09ACT8_00710 [soil metagenome]
MQCSLLMHNQEGPDAGLTDEDMATARDAFARYADDLAAAGVLISTQVLQAAATRAHLLAALGDRVGAVQAYEQALS